MLLKIFGAALAVLLLCLGVGLIIYNYYDKTPAQDDPVRSKGSGQGSQTKGNTSTQGKKNNQETYEIERTEYQLPKPEADDVLTDDQLQDKKATPFDPTLVDRRPLGKDGAWRLNASAAIVRLDVPLVLPDAEPQLLTLHPSYTAAIQKSGRPGDILPSVNLLDGKAKQFDDGLYAALDQAYYQGLQDQLLSHIQLVRRLYEKAGKDSVAAPFLAAGLELAGVHVMPADLQRKQEILQGFQDNPIASKPIGFYTWNQSLTDCFRFLRFFQRQFGPDQLAVPAAIAEVLEHDSALLADYRKAIGFYAKLTNPHNCLSVADIMGPGSLDSAGLARLAEQKKVFHRTVALFPPSTSRESVLFEALFPLGPPENVNLMRELVQRIRSGQVNLQPKPESGWYDHQVYALETLLLPEKGAERNKLLLTKTYKKRMLEAFKALMTKKRETHVRQLEIPLAPAMRESPAPVEKVKPRLRVEPAPTYYLRMARGYAFLANFLEASVGKDGLQRLHGLTKDGARLPALGAELQSMRDLFYGLYLLSAEDIGLKPAFKADEPVDQEHCYKAATAWLAGSRTDPDLAADTRVAVPIFVDVTRRSTRLWVTLGVRLTKLRTGYARAPQLKPARGEGAWQVVEDQRLEDAEYLIPVDEFAEVEIPGLNVLSREELRALCDREKTKEAILEALRK
jgi:hypothetical protein